MSAYTSHTAALRDMLHQKVKVKYGDLEQVVTRQTLSDLANDLGALLTYQKNKVIISYKTGTLELEIV